MMKTLVLAAIYSSLFAFSTSTCLAAPQTTPQTETAKGSAWPSDSIFNLSSQWFDQNGKQVVLADLAGQNVVFSLVYLTCQYTCPTTISEMQEIRRKLSSKVRSQTRFVLISIDPERDTPQSMLAYTKKRKLDSKEWTFLTAKNDREVRELAVALNFQYQKTPDGEFSHSFIIYGLDKTGVVKERVVGAGQDKAALIKVLK